MLKQKFTIIFIIIFNVTFSQSTQSSNSFEKEILEIKNEQSEYYYPKLLNKIKLNNENISKIDLKFLYYGQIYKTGTGLSFLDNSDEDNFRKSVYQKNCKKILKYGSSNLEKNPVELTTLLPICECHLEIK